MPIRRNPYRRYKLAERLTYPEFAARLGISVDYAKKLGTGSHRSVHPRRAKAFAKRTRGELAYDELMAWAASSPRRRRNARSRGAA